VKCGKMNKKIISTNDIPPPPPPPPTSASKRFSKTMIVAALVILLAIAVAGGAYYVVTLPHDNNPGPEPSPTALSSSSPTATSIATVTPSPSGTTSVGYRDGAWANYTTHHYDSGGNTTATYSLGYAVSQGIFHGFDVWILRTENRLLIDNSVMSTVTTYWLDQSTLQGLHYKIVITSNGVVISDTENDYSPGDFNDIPTVINPSMVISKESVTVSAGTFNCDKAVITQTDLGKTFVTTTWGNSNIPVVGMVKQTMTQDGLLISTTELTAYGG
jgi:hypothetical protein